MLNFYGVFYINICGFIGRGKFLSETRVGYLTIAISDIKFNCPSLIVLR